ncbi:hypothetical protein Pla123a_47750 [Posidoniimonas polymericola]|uniref:Sulfatase n=1 Tax=Posidoniimonas polymericola TaxID=2528002 RepID=A0A5C5XUL8_9BACT|nr:DUF1501 domain-containing protein [Posidoniimonas polymericola]TWT66251.1 hypothetical protein Pla123a_47750 [Posidoniimonas polymericola]
MKHQQNTRCTGREATVGMSRREMLHRSCYGLGAAALHQLLAGEANGGAATKNLTATASRVIFLFQSGAPSQMDLYDYKPLLNERQGQELPDSVRQGQRLTGMSANQSSMPLVGSPYRFARHGQSGMWFSELLPHTAQIADDLCVVKSMHTEAINHGPGVSFFQSGSPFPGRPSIGAWVDYGLGSENKNLPGFVVLTTKHKGGQPLVSSYWGNGFLPSEHQGARFRSGDNPILYLDNPAGVDAECRRDTLDALASLHKSQARGEPHGEIESQIAQYELAYRMQMATPEVLDLSGESQSTFDLYGEDAREPGTYASNCLLARRLAERGVRFIQLYHQDWDHHEALPKQLPRLCRETDRASAALVSDLKQRGLLEDTLVVWAGEFGRTNYCQGKLVPNNFGRDHHPKCFTLWAAGGGFKAGAVHGATDDFCYNIVDRPVSVYDFNATLLYVLGINHTRLTYRYLGRDFRLTDVHGEVRHELLS